MRLIDVDKLKEEIALNIAWKKPNSIFKVIDNAPTIDAVEVVRCKDCKRCKIQSWHEIDRKVTLYYSKEYKVYKDSDDYCSFGERREK